AYVFFHLSTSDSTPISLALLDALPIYRRRADRCVPGRRRCHARAAWHDAGPPVGCAGAAWRTVEPLAPGVECRSARRASPGCLALPRAAPRGRLASGHRHHVEDALQDPILIDAGRFRLEG